MKVYIHCPSPLEILFSSLEGYSFPLQGGVYRLHHTHSGLSLLVDLLHSIIPFVDLGDTCTHAGRCVCEGAARLPSGILAIVVCDSHLPLQ